MPGPERLRLLLDQSHFTGIDYVYVHPDHATLDVVFLVPPVDLKAALATPTIDHVRIHAEDEPDVELATVTWQDVGGQDALRVVAARPGGFARYQLRVEHDLVDRYFNDVPFSFKAGCPSDVDCGPRERACPPEAAVDFPVDYSARDFWSFRRALLDFAAQRYPDWQDRLEADAGVMLAEIMSALGDEHAYAQDRIAREGSLETASQRRSLRRHARLVDYDVHDGLGATTWLDVTVRANEGTQTLPAGADVWAESDGGARVAFEIGRGLADVLASATFAVDDRCNSLSPYLWSDDEDAICLPAGSTTMWIDGHHEADLTLTDAPPDRPPGRWVLLSSTPTDPSRPARRHVVRLVEVHDEDDLLLVDPITLAPHPVTRLVWEEAQALPFELDLETLVVRGNLVPATAGRVRSTRFSTGATTDPSLPRTVERAGPGGAIAYLFTLPDPAGEGLVQRGDHPRRAAPEIHLIGTEPAGAPHPWTWRRSLLGTQSSGRYDAHFTLDDGSYDRVVGFRRIGHEIVHVDYARGDGVTIRFGDGEIGMLPADGTVFDVTYRLGNGAQGNVAAGTLTNLSLDMDGVPRREPGAGPFIDAAFAFVAALENPLPVEDGLDPETPDEVRKDASDAFRAITYRAVRPRDYAEAAERLPWVQRAGASFRWTGSWLSAFVTPDPRSATTLAAERRRELEAQLDRFRQAGREVHILAPRYADLDLEIDLCVEPTAYPGDVKERVRRVLLGERGPRPRLGFFDPDRFTFGTPLVRSALEAAIQAVPGVRAVEKILIRRRGWFDWRVLYELTYRASMNEVIRLQNDPLHPDQGSLRLVTEGGA